MTNLATVPDPPADFGRPDPHDLAAEQAVLGAMMLSAAAAETCRSALGADDFYRPAQSLIFASLTAMMLAGEPVDAVTVKDHLEAAGELARCQGAPYLHTLIASVPVTANAANYARIVREHAVRRRLLLAGRRILQWAGGGTGDDGHGLTERAMREIEAARDAGQDDDVTAQTITEFLAGEDSDDYDWIIPDLLERGDRLVITGMEGAGKSTLLRQLGGTIAAGIHPFTHLPIPPRRVLIIDCENSPRQNRRKFRPLIAQASLQHHPVAEVNLWIESRPEGMDLALDRDVSRLLRQMTVIRPDVVMLGPLYRLAPRALNNDDDASEAALISSSMAYCHSSGWRVPWESKYAVPLFMVSEVSAWMALSTRPLAISALGPSRRVTTNILKLLAAATVSLHSAKCGGRLPVGAE